MIGFDYSEYLSQAEDVVYPRDLGPLSANKKKGRQLSQPIRYKNVSFTTNQNCMQPLKALQNFSAN